MSIVTYAVIWTKTSIKQLNELDKPLRIAIANKTYALGQRESSLDIKKLIGSKNLYRLLVGDFRIIFSINHDQKQFIIAEVFHRKDAYRSRTLSKYNLN